MHVQKRIPLSDACMGHSFSLIVTVIFIHTKQNSTVSDTCMCMLNNFILIVSYLHLYKTEFYAKLQFYFD